MHISTAHQQGMALVLVLWVLTLLTIMAGSFTLSMRRESSVISSIRDTAQATAIAAAGITLAESMLLSKDEEKRWKTNGTIYQLGFAGAAVRIQVFNERGKIDINASDQAQLKSLLEYADIVAEQQSELVDAILDWRDSNDLVRLNGAESKQYEQEGLLYHPRNKAFQSIDELQLVLGMNEEIFSKIEPLITINSKQKKVDKKSASQAVIDAIFGDAGDFQFDDDDKAPEVISVDDALTDQQIFAEAEDEDLTEQEKELEEESEEQNNQSLSGDAFTIVAEAKLTNGAKSMIKTIIRKSVAGLLGQPFDVLDWKRMQINDKSLFSE